MSESQTDKDGRAAARAIHTVASSRARFLEHLDKHTGGVEALSRAITELHKSPDPRVRARAVEIEVRVRGFFEHHDETPAERSIHFHMGAPKTRHPEQEPGEHA